MTLRYTTGKLSSMKKTNTGISQAIEYAGGTGQALADLLKVTPAAITKWRRQGLPPERAIQLERLSGGELRAIDLCPDRGGKAA